MNEIIYQSKIVWKNPFTVLIAVLTIAQIVLVIIFIQMLIKSLILTSFLILLVVYWLYRILISENIFRIYEDRIDFVKTVFQENILKSLHISEVEQVRYEDDFSNSSPFFSMGNFAKIFIYLNNDSEFCKSIKKDRVILTLIQNENREDAIIEILKVFKRNGVKIYVSTKFDKILTELDLENWTKP